MGTLIKSTGTSKTERKVINRDKFWLRAEENRLAIIAMLLLVLGCFGGIAAAFGAESDTLQIAVTVLPTILSLASMLAVAPMPVILSMSAGALFFDLLVLLF